MSVQSRSRASAVVGALAVALSGCTSSGGDDEPPAPSGLPGAGALLTAVSTMQGAAGQEQVDLAGDELPVVGTRPSSNGQTTFDVELNGVVARGALMTVVFTIRVTGDKDFRPAFEFDDGAERGTAAGVNPTSSSTDGVYVLDAAQGRRHLAAYDSEDLCVCTTGLDNQTIQPGGSQTWSTTFSAPPETTESVDVVIPTVGAFPGVPLIR